MPGLVADQVVCPGVDGPNLAADALRAFRERTGWDGAPVRLEIDKHIPVASGMAGGSADAAAALRLAAEASGIGDRRLLEDIGATLGADVASQIRGGLVLATGTGARLRPLNMSLAYTVVVVPVDAELSAAEVYAEADRLGLPRDQLDLARSLTRTQAALSSETILERAAQRPAGRGALAVSRDRPGARVDARRGRRSRARVGLGSDRARGLRRAPVTASARAASATRWRRRAGPRSRCSAARRARSASVDRSSA